MPLSGMVGEPLLPVDEQLVLVSPLRQFMVGETIAFKDAQGVLRYGVVRKVQRDQFDALATLTVRALTQYVCVLMCFHGNLYLKYAVRVTH